MSLNHTPSEIFTLLQTQGRLGLLSASESWQRVPLGEIVEVQNGLPFDSKRFNAHGDGIPLLRIRDIGRNIATTFFAGDVPPEYMVNPGDLLVGMDGDFRIAEWHGAPAALNQRVCRLIPNAERVLPKFLLFHLQGWLDAIGEHTSSTTVKHLSSKTIQQIPFPLPSIEQQHEIVERIESALARLDSALGKLNLAEGKRENVRLALLHKHFGRSKTERDSLKLSDVLETQIGGAWGDLPGSGEFEVKVLRATEMDKLGRLNLTSAVDRSVTMSQYVSRELIPGDLVMEKSGGGPNQPVGRVGLYNGPAGGYITSNFMLKMRPNSELIDPNFLWLQLMYTHLSGGTIAIQSSSTNIRNVTVSEYLNLEIFVPSLEKQRSIALELTDSMGTIDAAALQLVTIRKFIDSERRAILQAAFSPKGEDK